MGETDESCTQKVNEGTLDSPGRDVDALYSGTVSNVRQDAPLAAVSVLGNAFFIGWGVAFFVSGLLGWLLLMKKRVLQCDVCGAVVNAS